MAQEEHLPRWVEHGPERLWQGQLRTARRVLAEGQVGAREITTIGISD
jgi:glycerol kinase